MKPISTSCKEEIANAAVTFVAEDLRSFSAIEGKGLLKLANALINVGAKHGKVDAATTASCKKHYIETSRQTCDKLRHYVEMSLIVAHRASLIK